MNTVQAIAEYRRTTGDKKAPYRCSDTDIVAWLGEAVDEATERARLIRDKDTPDVCSIPLIEAESDYTLHPKVFAVERVLHDGQPLRRTSIQEMQADDSEWETRTGKPAAYIEEAGYIRIVPIPSADYAGDALALTVYRLQLVPPALKDQGAAGAYELPERVHRDLLHWVYYRAYDSHDPDTGDMRRSAEALTRFTEAFGEKIDANVKRKQRHAGPRTVRINSLFSTRR